VELSSERQRQILDEERQRLAEEKYRSRVRSELGSENRDTPPVPVEKTRQSAFSLRRGLQITFLVVVLIYAFSVLLSTLQHPQGASGAGSSSSALRPFRKSLLLGSVAVSPLQYRYWKFEVSDTMVNARVIGSFHASGGFGNDIETVLAEWDQCENWLNGHQAHVLYVSGKVTNGVLDVPIQRAGTYCLAFSNKMALVSSKTVSGDIALRSLIP